MKNKRSVGIAVILLLALPLICFGQVAVTKATPKYEEGSLQLTIKSDKEVYEVGEDIIVTLYIRNRGKEDVIYGLPPFFEQQPKYPDYAWVDTRVFLQNGENIVVKSKTRGIIESLQLQHVPMEGALQQQVVIEPGKEYSQSFVISPCFDFKADIYEIYLENEMTEKKLKTSGVNWTGTLTSNTITIEVVKVKGGFGKCWEKAKSIKIGMTQAEVEKIAWKDGGTYTSRDLRYFIPDRNCYCGDDRFREVIKVDVKFSADMAWPLAEPLVEFSKEEEIPKDSEAIPKVIKVSEPYCEGVFTD